MWDFISNNSYKFNKNKVHSNILSRDRFGLVIGFIELLIKPLVTTLQKLLSQTGVLNHCLHYAAL
jgi:hypothetical protein